MNIHSLFYREILTMPSGFVIFHPDNRQSSVMYPQSVQRMLHTILMQSNRSPKTSLTFTVHFNHDTPRSNRKILASGGLGCHPVKIQKKVCHEK